MLFRSTFGTGRLVNTGDLSSTGVQSIYAIKDALQSSGIGGSGATQVALRDTASNLVKQTLNADRTISPASAVDWTAQNGWYVDLLLSAGERAVLDGVPLGDGVIAYASSVPNSDPCSGGGTSYLYQFTVGSGALAAKTLSYGSLLVGIGRIVDSNGKVSVVTTQRNQALSLAAAGSGMQQLEQDRR